MICVSNKRTRTDALLELCQQNQIKSYVLQNVNADGKLGEPSDSRNTERLTLVFPNDMKLVIDTFCSGSAEDTTLHFKLSWNI
jgi:hypothetical protein